MDGFRCATASRERGEALAGTASTHRSFLLLEEPGPWGRDAWRDARLPDGLGPEVLRRAAPLGLRPLLARQQHRRRPRRRRVLLAATDASGAGRLETGTVSDPREVLDLDLAGFVAGGPGGLTPTTDPVYAVCTHGRHDACCAERGRPALAAVAGLAPEAAWGVSHVGGDRFAGNLLVLPGGLYFGGLGPDSAVRVVLEHRAGRVALEHFRGRSCWAPSIQAAEVALRRHLSLLGLGDLAYAGRTREGDLALVRFRAEGSGWLVTVRRDAAGPARLTCHAAGPEPAARWVPVSVTPHP